MKEQQKRGIKTTILCNGYILNKKNVIIIVFDLFIKFKFNLRNILETDQRI